MAVQRDPLEGAMLVSEARLHLGTVMVGQSSEPFFEVMLKIIDKKIYLGYLTLNNREVKLSGIKDFLFNANYGLGIKNKSAFISGMVKAATKEKSKNHYGYKFIDWLKTQDESLSAPQEFFEYRRLMREVAMDRRIERQKRLWLFEIIRMIYRDRPELLFEIGPDQKYKTVVDCYFGEGFSERKKSLKPIKLFSNPTNHQVREAAKILYERLGAYKTKILLLALIDEHKRFSRDSTGDGTGVPAMDADSARS